MFIFKISQLVLDKFNVNIENIFTYEYSTYVLAQKSCCCLSSSSEGITQLIASLLFSMSQ